MPEELAQRQWDQLDEVANVTKQLSPGMDTPRDWRMFDVLREARYNRKASLLTDAQLVATLDRGDFTVETHQRRQSVRPHQPSSLAFSCEPEALIADLPAARPGATQNLFADEMQSLNCQDLLRFKPKRPRRSAPTKFPRLWRG
jgi:hypothetical protein